MSGKIKNIILSLFTQDMEQQVGQVKILAVMVFFILLLAAGWLWQYKIELTAQRDGQRVVVAKMNVFQLLLSKKE